MQIKKTNKQTPWTQNQQDQLKALAATAIKFMRHKQDLPVDMAIEEGLVQLQRAFPLVEPHLLYEAACFAVELNNRFCSTARERAKNQRERCKLQRTRIYWDLGLTFNV